MRASGRSGEHGVVGSPQSQDGFSDDGDEKGKKKRKLIEGNGFVMDAERDTSGLVVGYHLIPPQTGKSTTFLSY